MIHALSYVVVHTPYLPQWMRLAAEQVGLQVEPLPDEVRGARLRMDEKFQRLLLLASVQPDMIMGFEVADAEQLATVTCALVEAGFPVSVGNRDECDLRGVTDFLYFLDPDGRRVEVAWGLADAATPFQPGRPLGGFRTGEQGIGHVALITEHFDEMCRLYKDVLGFRVSDRAHAPFRVEFLHVNPRHHTLGIAHTGSPAQIYHLMLEYRDFDDLGRAYDIALENPGSIGVTLGRHINDHVTSFYLKNPDGWMLELGWAGRTIGPDWKVTELDGMSLWGHDRTWLSPARREEARQILKRLASQGVRAPVVTDSQNRKPTP